MAQPITFVPKPAAPSAPHAEAIDSALELLQLLHDRGALDLLRGLVGASGELTGLVSTALNSPEAIRGIRNFLLLTKFFATIRPEILSGLVQTATDGTKRMETGEAPSLLQLIRRLSSAESRRALSVLADLLEGAGKRI
jgi:uncharacterized protein YjgD (DUF1641 family)